MALPKKGLRKIVVDELKFGWKTSADHDWCILLTIAPIEIEGSNLMANFYHHKYFGYPEDKHFIITPHVVKQLIAYAKSKGWNPIIKGNPMQLGNMDGNIDWNKNWFDNKM